MHPTSGTCFLPRRSVVSAALPALLAMLPALQPAEVSAGGFSKKKEKAFQEAAPPPPKPKMRKPIQATLVPDPATPSMLRALPVTAPANYAPSPPRSGSGPVRVFVLGDSQSLLPFGLEFQRTLAESGCEVLFHAVKNGTPYYWQGQWPSPVLTRLYEPAASPEQCGRWTEVPMRPLSIAEYVAAYDPEVFVFQAGTNFEDDLASGHPNLVKLLREGLDHATARGARVLWIGPPDARDDKRSVEAQDRATAVLRAALADVSAAQGFDSFFDSRPVCPIPNDATGDGEHPADPDGAAWGAAAGTWVADAIAQWRSANALRPAGASPATSAAPLFTRSPEPSPVSTTEPLHVELELLAKSDPGDIATLPYTDAFSVFRYRVRNAPEIQDRLSRLGVPPAADGGGPILHVLHWSVHNNGSGPRATRVAARPVGGTFAMSLLPLSEHPLGEAVGTMARFDDFDDFLAPLFAAADLPAERELEAGR